MKTIDIQTIESIVPADSLADAKNRIYEILDILNSVQLVDGEDILHRYVEYFMDELKNIPSFDKEFIEWVKTQSLTPEKQMNLKNGVRPFMWMSLIFPENCEMKFRNRSEMENIFLEWEGVIIFNVPNRYWTCYRLTPTENECLKILWNVLPKFLAKLNWQDRVVLFQELLFGWWKTFPASKIILSERFERWTEGSLYRNASIEEKYFYFTKQVWLSGWELSAEIGQFV